MTTTDWITNHLGHIRLATPAVAADLPDPATPGDPVDPWANLGWLRARIRSLEGQRQMDLAARDWAALDARILGSRFAVKEAEVVRLRAHLAAAGLALDELTAPASAPAKVPANVRYIDAETGEVAREQGAALDERIEDAVAPLVAQIDAMAGHMAHHRLPLDDCDPITCTCRGLYCGLTVGDLRRIVEVVREQGAAIAELRAEADRLRTRAG